MLRLGITILALICGCFSNFTDARADERLPVFVGILPLQYFVQQIGRDLVDVQVMVMPGANPATYEPKPRQMAAVAKSRLYFAVGVPFENVWLKKITATNPEMLVVHTEKGIKKRSMQAHHHDDEDQHVSDTAVHTTTEAEHQTDKQNPRSLDPHIWTAPPLVMIMAKNILQALQAADTVHKARYEDNYKAFRAEIANVDAALKEIFADAKGRGFIVFHPSWGYFADTYDLMQVPIEVEGKAPKSARLKTLIVRARAQGVKVIFAQPQFSTKSAQLIATAIGAKVVLADPLAYNWAENLRTVAEAFRAALK